MYYTIVNAPDQRSDRTINLQVVALFFWQYDLTFLVRFPLYHERQKQSLLRLGSQNLSISANILKSLADYRSR